MKDAAKPKAASADSFGGFTNRFFTASIGAKVAMAITGFGLVIFILGHLVGNLLIFGGPDATNGYAEKLHSSGLLLWTARAGILFLFLVHILVSLRTKVWDQESRPVPYAMVTRRATNLASRTMIVTGLLILAFLIYHLAHFTLGLTNPAEFAGAPAQDPLTPNTVYSMVVKGFGHPVVSMVYGVAMILLGLHMSHGIQSLFQHLGLWGQRFARWIRGASVFLAVVIAVLFICIPAAILLGLVH